MDELDQLRQKIIKSKTFCFYPYTQISTSPGGLLKPCCNYVGSMNDGPRGDVNIFNKYTFESAWNCKSIVEMRKDMFNNVIPEKCARCIRDGDTSQRARSVAEYKNDYKTLEMVKATIDNNFRAEHKPTYLELKPSNLCNLKCVMCNSYDSSQIRKELQELNEKHQGIVIKDGRFIKISEVRSDTIRDENKWLNFNDVEWDDNTIMWEEFERIAPTLEVLSFAGGEPTIMPSVMKALKYCVDKGYSKNIKVFLSSNFTNLNKQFFELMIQYKKFELIASIDAFDKVQEYCRFPSKWSQISKNYIEAKKYMKYPNVKILVNITVTMFNVLNLTDLFYWIEERAKEYPYYNEWPFNINLIYFPVEQQIAILPKQLRDTAAERLREYIKNSQILKEFPGMRGNIDLLISELSKDLGELPVHFDSDVINLNSVEEKEQYINKLKTICVDRVKVLDEHRGVDIREYIPELGEFFYDEME